MTEQLHGGFAITRALKAFGVEHIFTLTGGHIFPILDAGHQDGFRMIDTRHEASAAFAAEGWARLTRTLGVCAVTAGPGVTNALSPLAQASANSAPMLVLAGRAPSYRWGAGSLQEIDHVPFVAPLAPARTVTAPEDISAAVVDAAGAALTAPRGPRFLDFPLDVLFSTTAVEAPEVDLWVEGFSAPMRWNESSEAWEVDYGEASGIVEVARLLAAAERPVMVAGSNVWLDRAEGPLRALAERAQVPVFMNGQGRGCLPADHPLAFSRARSKALREADLVIVAGTPLDFRLGFGDFPGAVVHIDAGPLATHVELAAGLRMPTDAAFSSIEQAYEGSPRTQAWLEALRAEEHSRAEAVQAELTSAARPIHPLRVYGELVPLLERDAIVIGDGGDFVSFAGREVPSYEGGCWLDPGPFGCLGCGPGYALAARIAHPDRQVVILYGDGAFGFSGMELETFVRLGLPVVAVIGNNGIWALEKHPMRMIYGYDVAAELRPGVRYDLVMRDLGGDGELVEDPDDLGPALKRAFDSGVPYVVNVLTDPEVAYPRSSNLA